MEKAKIAMVDDDDAWREAHLSFSIRFAGFSFVSRADLSLIGVDKAAETEASGLFVYVLFFGENWKFGLHTGKTVNSSLGSLNSSRQGAVRLSYTKKGSLRARIPRRLFN